MMLNIVMSWYANKGVKYEVWNMMNDLKFLRFASLCAAYSVFMENAENMVTALKINFFC
jgi:regulatory protein YycI of two-component signal transduction system YycFG